VSRPHSTAQGSSGGIGQRRSHAQTRENLSQVLTASSLKAAGIAPIRVQAELDLATAPPLQQLLDDRVKGGSRIIGDLSDCVFIDSIGIALIVLAFRELGEVKPSMGLLSGICRLHPDSEPSRASPDCFVSNLERGWEGAAW
jgi:anti-anti-sigma factor